METKNGIRWTILRTNKLNEPNKFHGLVRNKSLNQSKTIILLGLISGSQWNKGLRAVY